MSDGSDSGSDTISNQRISRERIIKNRHAYDICNNLGSIWRGLYNVWEDEEKIRMDSAGGSCSDIFTVDVVFFVF